MSLYICLLRWDPLWSTSLSPDSRKCLAPVCFFCLGAWHVFFCLPSSRCADSTFLPAFFPPSLYYSIPHPTNTQSCFSQFVVNPRSPISILLLPSMSPSGAAIDPGEGNPSRIHARRIQTSGFLFLAKWSNSNRLPVRCWTGMWRCLPGQVRRWGLHCLGASTFTRLTPH